MIRDIGLSMYIRSIQTIAFCKTECDSSYRNIAENCRRFRSARILDCLIAGLHSLTVNLLAGNNVHKKSGIVLNARVLPLI